MALLWSTLSTGHTYTYVTSDAQIAQAMSHITGDVVGVDSEYSNDVTLLQISCRERTVVVNLKLITQHESIIALFSDERIVKVGFALDGDVERISRKFSISFVNCMDLQRWEHAFKGVDFHQMKSASGVSLKSLAKQRLDIELEKSVRMSDWSTQLTKAQLAYAALDSFCCLQLYEDMRHEPRSIKRQIYCFDGRYGIIYARTSSSHVLHADEETMRKAARGDHVECIEKRSYVCSTGVYQNRLNSAHRGAIENNGYAWPGDAVLAYLERNAVEQ